MKLERAERKNQAGSWVRTAMLARLLYVTTLAAAVIGFLTGFMARTPSTQATVLWVLGGVVVLGTLLLYLRHLDATWLRGFDAERRVGDFIEHALTQSDCAFAHDVKEALGGSGNVDHIAMMPTGLWVVETKARRPQGHWFKAALKQTAGNVQRVRGHLKTDLPVRGALVIADPDLKRFEAEYDWHGESVMYLDAKSLWRRLRSERRAAASEDDMSEVARVRELVWNLGSAAHVGDG